MATKVKPLPETPAVFFARCLSSGSARHMVRRVLKETLEALYLGEARGARERDHRDAEDQS